MNNPDEAKDKILSAIFNDIYTLLEVSIQQSGVDTLWYDSFTTAHDQLILIAERYSPESAKALQDMLEVDSDLTEKFRSGWRT